MAVEFEITERGFDPLLLGMSLTQADAAVGEFSKPDGAGLPGEAAFRYEAADAQIVLRDDRAVELALSRGANAVFRGRRLFQDPDVWREIVTADPDPRESYGFLVLRTLGLTLTGFHDDDRAQRAITAFEPGRWDAFEDTLKPFRM